MVSHGLLWVGIPCSSWVFMSGAHILQFVSCQSCVKKKRVGAAEAPTEGITDPAV